MFVGVLLPYVTLIVFVVGIIYHISLWRKLPAPKMTLTPAPKPGFPRFVEFMKETLFFRSLFKGDKNLWFLSWIFHVMLAFIFIGHLRVFSWLPDKMLAGMGMTEEGITEMSRVTGGGAGIIILAMVAFLLLRRLFTGRVREISKTGDYIAIFLVLLVLITGDAMRFLTPHFNLAETREYFQGLFTFSAIALPANKWFVLHYFFAQLLIMYMPFSKLLHFGGIFFTEALIQKH
jgi:nitrate reductase gamma subunit